MIVAMEYRGRSAIVNGLRQARVAFAANRLRDAVQFRGEISQPLLLREALATMHRVVVSDFKYRPRDRVEFRAWLEEQDRLFLDSLGMKNKKAQAQLEQLEARLAELNTARKNRLLIFQHARTGFLSRLYKLVFEDRYIFDPVVSVHPDELSLEAFSRDESTYARLAAKHELFDRVHELQCGTTNIDFSTRLFTETERLRTYRTTALTVDPGGVTVSTDGGEHREKKIDLPDSWVMGFLQVQSTMALGLTRFHMAPVDLYNICRFLRRHKTRTSPRALRYELVPGMGVRAVLEPWEYAIDLTPAPPLPGEPPLTLALTPGAIYNGNKPLSVRTWGRDRLQLLARLIPLTRRIDVFLAGHGLPAIYVLDLGPLTFTLALSGWTDNDWTGGAKFELLARRLSVSAGELAATYDVLRDKRSGSEGALALATGLGVEKTRSALSYLCQVGRAMYDLAGSVYRHRELFTEPFTVKEAIAAAQPKKAPTNPQEKAALAIFDRGDVRITSRRPVSTGYKLTGSARGTTAERVRPLLHVDHEGRIVEASCTCAEYKKFQLTRGPCEHILALRLAHMHRLETEDREGG
jgi:hypothetical protein